MTCPVVIARALIETKRQDPGSARRAVEPRHRDGAIRYRGRPVR